MRQLAQNLRPVHLALGTAIALVLAVTALVMPSTADANPSRVPFGRYVIETFPGLTTIDIDEDGNWVKSTEADLGPEIYINGTHYQVLEEFHRIVMDKSGEKLGLVPAFPILDPKYLNHLWAGTLSLETGVNVEVSRGGADAEGRVPVPKELSVSLPNGLAIRQAVRFFSPEAVRDPESVLLAYLDDDFTIVDLHTLPAPEETIAG